MAKIRYRYNPESLSYDKVKTSVKSTVIKALTFIGISLVIVATYIVGLSSFLSTPKEKALSHELNRVTFNYKILQQRVDQIDLTLSDMQQRDDNIYRTVFELDPIPQSIRQAGIGGVNRYEALEGYINSGLMIDMSTKVDKITRQMYVQSKSYDELIERIKNRELILATKPAIQPIDNKDLKRTASGYGWRTHPIYKDRRFHHGMDFTAPTGTDIYATGDGRVTAVGYNGGLGNRVIVDHGFGYETVYAHMSKFSVKVGDVVKRGQVIGYVGNTGDSTGPHLHYEVHKSGRSVNPVNYYYEDLSPEEYALILDLANSGEMYD
ncbi:MAG: M23 family metallopeptidase [Bacteroidales bacterium]|jgi:murein DD-endopeptidase MepM/ murein hydrolase activator NlpD|nr:M23 family metallopeptidase [Bacteroidales bacterium]